MRRSARWTGAVLALAAAAWLAVASPVMAAPRQEPAGLALQRSPRIFAELLASLGQWFEGFLLQNISSASGDGVVPEDSPGSPGAGGGPGGSITPQGGHELDPNG